MTPTKLTITRAAVEFGVSRDTLTRNLSALGLKVSKGETFTLRQLHHALAGDLKFERTRKERELADKLARENKVATGEMVRMSEVEQVITERLVQPLCDALNGMPMALAQLCNPANPEQAQSAIDNYLERNLKPHLRSKLNPEVKP